MSSAQKTGLASSGRLRAGLRHSRRVVTLRVLLPSLGGGLLLILMLWPVVQGKKIIRLPPVPTLPNLTMEQPHFSGSDEQNHPYTLHAERATQRSDDPKQFDLLHPQATLRNAEGQPVLGRAGVGRFDQTSKLLWLGGTVEIEENTDKTNAPLRFTTDELFADLKRRNVWGDKPVRLTGSFGSIEGQGFRMIDGGKVMLFTGPSRAILNGHGDWNAVSPLPPSPTVAP